MPRVSKPRSRVRQQDQRPSSTQPSVVVPSNLGELSISELKNLCRELNFSCAGGRRLLTTRLQNERERLSTNTPQSNIQTVPVNHTLSNSNAIESFSTNQLAQITQIVSQSISSFFESQPATTATRVDEQSTIPPLPTPLERLEQLGQFPFLSSSELQQQPTSSHGPVASIQQADGGFTPEIPNKYVCDIESGEFFQLAKLLPKNLSKLNVGSDSSDNVGFTIDIFVNQRRGGYCACANWKSRTNISFKLIASIAQSRYLKAF